MQLRPLKRFTYLLELVVRPFTMAEWSSSVTEAGVQPNWREQIQVLISAEKWSPTIQPIAEKIANCKRVTIDEGLILYKHKDLTEIGKLASLAKAARYGKNVFFNSNVHINQTNICVLSCKFCAFRRSKKQTDSYELSIDSYLGKLDEYSPYVDEVHSVGGLHPDWDIGYYETLFQTVRDKYPNISIKALTAVEIKHLAKNSNLSFQDILIRLKNSGLTSIPGGGAEILNDEIRDIICRGKETTSEYLEIHEAAHMNNIPSNCTMLFGTLESLRDRLVHMDLLRRLADKYSMFQCFVPYPFLPDHSRLPEAQLATANEILRTIAISRLMLDSIPHIKAYRMNIGDELAEIALHYGADDVDGTVGQESIMHLAGAKSSLNYNIYNMAKLITDAGFVPIKRDTTYQNFTTVSVEAPKRIKKLNVIQS